MEIINKISRATKPQDIVSQLADNLSGNFDLGLIFISNLNSTITREVISILKTKISIRYFMGCTCAGVIGNSEEIEQTPAISLFLAKMPEVKILPFTANQMQLEQIKQKEDWYNFFEVFPNENPVFICLPDPFEFDMDLFLHQINQAFPNCPIVGGLASASYQPGGNLIFVNEEEKTQGLVGLILTGNIQIKTIVSQGCRPIGETFIVTKAEGNIIYELAGQPLLDILKKTLDKATARDKLLAQEAMFVGIAMNEYKEKFSRGDFLIRGLVGIDTNSGAGAVADYIEMGQTVQFHVRDAQTATEDLNELLKTYSPNKPKGALVFSCNGRGEHLFKEKNHDIKIIQSLIGPVPAAGFFCAGEIGPVAGYNFLHGFTDSIALFYPQQSK